MPPEDDYWPAEKLTAIEDYWYAVEDRTVYRLREEPDWYAAIATSVATGITEIAFVFPLEVGKRWYLNEKMQKLYPGFETDSMLRQVIGQGAVETPTETFEQCFQMTEVIGGDTFETWFCPGVGIVARKADHSGTPSGMRELLMGYSILPDEPATESNFVSPVATGLGVIITSVMPGGPADQAGLQQGDVIIAIDGQRLDFDHDLVEIISAYDPGDVVTLQVERPGERVRKETIKLGQHPGQEEKAHLGVVYRPTAQAEVSEAGLNPAPGTIHLASRDITREELTRLAPFEVLWPQDLPDGY